MTSKELIYARLEERRNSRSGDRWFDVLDVAAIITSTPARSPQRKAEMAAITERVGILPTTQRQMLRIFEASIDPATGDVTLPTRLHFSTALLMAQRGATRDELMQANDGGWTLKKARAWAIDRARVPTEGKPVTLWRHLTKVMPKAIKAADKLDEPARVEAEAIFRDALRQFCAWD